MAGATFPPLVGPTGPSGPTGAQGPAGATGATGPIGPSVGVSVKSYGAVGDGTTDDTAAIQAAINHCLSTQPQPALYFPAGVYRITSTLNYTGYLGIRTYGDGMSPNTGYASTMLKWDGASTTTPMIQLTGCPFSVFENFGIYTNSKPLFAAFRSTAVSTYLKTHNTWRNLFVGGGGYIDKGWIFDCATTPDDGNNDLNLFEKVWVNNCITACVSFEHSQSLGHTFLDCQFSGGNPASCLYGVTTALGSGGYQPGNGGSFNWFGGLCSGFATASFYIGSATDSFTIQDVTAENSLHLLKTANNNNVPMPVSLIGCITRGTGQDQNIVDYRVGGPLTIMNCNFLSDNVAGIQMYVAPHGDLNAVCATAIGNRFYQSGTTDPFAASGNVKWTCINNFITDSLNPTVPYYQVNRDDNSPVIIDPQDVGGLQLDLDPSLQWSVTSSGGAISQILDQSGNSNTASQSGSGKPTLVSAGLNGYDVIQFTAANSQFFTLASGINTTNGVTIIALVKKTSTGDFEFLGKQGATSKYSLVWEKFTGGSFIYMAVANNAKGYMDSPAHSDATSYHVIVGVTDGTSTQSRIYYDGIDITGSYFADSGTLSLDTMDQVGYSDAKYSDGLMARMLVYNRALPASTIMGVTNYFKNKYGL